MPQLDTLEILKLVNCPETFTPDMRCIMGESPLAQGYFVLAGMNSAGLSFAGAAGKSERMVEAHSRGQWMCPEAKAPNPDGARFLVECADMLEGCRAPLPREHKR